jgi:hypothetical protein
MASARSRKSLSTEEIFTKTCADTLFDVWCWFIESGDDNIDNESDRDFDPEIARKIERSLLCFSSNSESMSAKNKTALIEMTLMQLEGL